MGLILVGLSTSVTPPAGWKTVLSSVTLANTVITVTPLAALNFIKLSCVATQGDRLQIFFLTVEMTDASPQSYPFDHATLVKFDPDHLPMNVLVIPMLGGTETINQDYDKATIIFGLKSPQTLSYSSTGPQTYASLYAANGPFSTAGRLTLSNTWYVTQPFNLSFSLILQKFDDLTKTSGYLLDEYR